MAELDPCCRGRGDEALTVQRLSLSQKLKDHDTTSENLKKRESDLSCRAMAQAQVGDRPVGIVKLTTSILLVY